MAGMGQRINFALKLRLALVRFLSVLEYHMYTPLDKNLHIAQSINFSSEIGIATNNPHRSIHPIALQNLFDHIKIIPKNSLHFTIHHSEKVVKSMHQENEFGDVRLAMHALCQSLQRDGT